MNRFWNGVVSVCAAVAISGCASVGGQIRAYEGPARLLEEIAIIRCAPYVTVNSVDGNPAYRVAARAGSAYQDCEIELLPGQHRLDACFHAADTIATQYVTLTYAEGCGADTQLTLNAEAGRIYRIKLQRIAVKGGSQSKVWIEDVTRDEKTIVIEDRRKRAEEKK